MLRHALTAGLASLIASGCASDEAPICQTPTTVLERLGEPGWIIPEVVIFAAPYEAGDAVIETVTTLLPHPGWGFEEGVGPVAGEPTTESFDRYLSARTAALSWPGGPTFAPSDIDGRRAIYLAFLAVPSPDAEAGTTPDHPDSEGPMIPHRAYPFTLEGTLFRDCEVLDPNLDRTVRAPPMSAEAYRGQSRIPFFAFHAYRSEGVLGHYVHEQTLLDAQGSGYRFAVPFEVAE